MEGSGRARAVTQAEVAQEAGVSRGLVSMALAGSSRVAPTTRNHILATAQRLGYRVNRSAAALASGHSGLLGLVLPDLRNPFFDYIAHCLQEAARQAGLTLIIAIASGSPDDDGAGRQALEALLAMQLEGLVLVSPAMSDAAIRALGEETSVCLVGRASAGGATDTVRLDEAAAASAVVAHLREAGADSLVYLTPPRHEDPNAVERGEALRHAAVQADTELETVVAGAQSSSGLRQALQRAWDRGFHPGVVAHNDVVALDALAVLRGSALWVPLVSYDDTYLARREEFSITSVEQPAETMARDAIRFVCERSGRVQADDADAAGGTDGDAAEDASALPPAASQGRSHVGAGRHVTVAPVLAVRASSILRG
ncbi:LacI family DNA-binding transcriptional regulator [Actinomyces faecalis]|uniref:LacI family DNA-binding transcriptional regulator n=1 Tax=Actinomyces faecalis TaxID=2722820 RepID=UPI00155696F4|nr:LacI family DNA-binding transcriptional regulator [Actinomyces faecalis]